MASEIRVNTFKNRSGLGTITVNDDGANFSGIVTSTAVQVGSATTIHATGIDLGSGNITSHNINSTGIITATSFNGNLTGNVTGNVTGGITTTSITIGNSFIKSNHVGIGSVTTSERDSLTGIATGSLVYNTSFNVLQVYTGSAWETVGDQTTVLSASGGNVTDTSNRPGYTSHIFTGPGTLTVSAGADTADILVVGGGGGGGAGIGGGAGAGGMRLVSTTLVPGSYTVTIGNGGSPGSGGGSGGGDGSPTTFVVTSGGVGFSSITGTGGGSGGWPGTAGGDGGSGGAYGGTGNAGGNDPRATPVSEGNDGYPAGYGGGAGAGRTGYGPGPTVTEIAGGGDGLPVSWAPPSYGTPGPSPGRWFAGGGGGGGQWGPARSPGGFGGGGSGGNTIPSPNGNPGTTNTGGGGGGGWFFGSSNGGAGGSGIVIVSYPNG